MISVHMTTYRRLHSGLLRRAVKSVLEQTYGDFEFIICDDASNDGSIAYLSAVASADNRVKIIRNPHNLNSVALSLGRCLKKADPLRPYITWMFDDCTLEPDTFQILMNNLHGGEMDFVFGATRVHNADGSTFLVGDRSCEFVRAGIDASPTLVPNGALLIRRSVLERVGWYDANIALRRSCDWDLFRRIIRSGATFGICERILMDEYGSQQVDSLRNTFTTSFDIMSKFVHNRDKARVDLNLDAVLSSPVDFIPPGDWKDEELGLLFVMFLEYFLSVGDLSRAFVWSKRLHPHLRNPPFFLENLSAVIESSHDSSRGLMSAGALAAGIYWSYRLEQVTR